MASSQNFFRKVVHHNKLTNMSSTSFTNVGGCGFRTLAEWFLNHIDNYLLHPRKKMTLVSAVLNRHFVYFPQHKLNATGLMTHAQWMKQLKNDVPSFAEALVYTLRRIAFDELCADPVRYHSAFANLNKITTLEAMFQSMTTLDENCIAALANVLKLTIEIQDVASCKTIYKLTRYKDDEHNHSACLCVVMQRQDDGYFMLCTAKDTYFTPPKSRLTEPQVLIAQKATLPNHSMSEILAKLAEESDKLRARFQQSYAALVVADIKKEDLLAIYFKQFVRGTDSPCDDIRIGTEHGNQPFFTSILGQASRPVLELSERYDEQIATELRLAIARALSLGYLSLNDVHACIDHEEALMAAL